MIPIYNLCTVSKTKPKENYNYTTRKNTSYVRKKNQNLCLCPYNVDADGIWALKRIPIKRIAVNSVEYMLFANLAKQLGIEIKRA